MKCTVTTNTAEETEALAKEVGRRLKGGEVIELISDLGGGKTTFVRGLAKGFGSNDRVASPTFSISKLYKAGNKELHHFDFYRLSDAGVVGHELHDVVGNKSMVIVIEWAKAVHHVIPAERLTIVFHTQGDSSRKLEIESPEKLTYLVEDLC